MLFTTHSVLPSHLALRSLGRSYIPFIIGVTSSETTVPLPSIPTCVILSNVMHILYLSYLQDVMHTHFEKHQTQHTEQIGLSKRIVAAIENVALAIINVIESVQIRRPVCCGERVMTVLRHNLQYWSAR
jgi:hypothetical protein